MLQQNILTKVSVKSFCDAEIYLESMAKASGFISGAVIEKPNGTYICQIIWDSQEEPVKGQRKVFIYQDDIQSPCKTRALNLKT
jgi:hypothetical protein